jgi:nicotinamide-nucleotide amidase
MDLKIARNIHRLMKKKGLTLSVAESCTAGLISHYLTTVPGASSIFIADVVAYSAEAKKKILGIPQRVLDVHGVISGQTAIQMARRVRTLTNTDAAVSTTGNLGPGLLEHKPKGLVYVAVSTRKKTIAKKLLLTGSRRKIKETAALSALALLAEVVGND